MRAGREESQLCVHPGDSFRRPSAQETSTRQVFGERLCGVCNQSAIRTSPLSAAPCAPTAPTRMRYGAQGARAPRRAQARRAHLVAGLRVPLARLPAPRLPGARALGARGLPRHGRAPRPPLAAERRGARARPRPRLGLRDGRRPSMPCLQRAAAYSCADARARAARAGWQRAPAPGRGRDGARACGRGRLERRGAAAGRVGAWTGQCGRP